MRATDRALDLVKEREGLRLNAYRDTGGLPTIGFGTTRYPPWHMDGRRVKMGDACTEHQADLFFRYDFERTEDWVDALTTDRVRPEQFDALCSFGYNVGEGAYRTSTLRRLVNENPDNPLIRYQFMRWVYDDGVKVPGLINRRKIEADLYFSGVQLAA